MANDFIKILEDVGISKEKINDVVLAVEGLEKKAPGVLGYDVDNLAGQVTAIKLAMDKEIDWRKKAELAARIISLELDI